MPTKLTDCTPGPWAVFRDKWVIPAPDIDKELGFTTIPEEKGKFVRLLTNIAGTLIERNPIEGMANAELMAKSPEMYSILLDIHKRIQVSEHIYGSAGKEMSLFQQRIQDVLFEDDKKGIYESHNDC